MQIRPVPKSLSITLLPDEDFKSCWEQLIAAEDSKTHLLILIQLYLSPHIFVEWHRKYNESQRISKFKGCALLAGAPGTGKTMLAKAAADRYARFIGEKVYFAELRNVRSKYEGESSKIIEETFSYLLDLAKEYAVIFFIDEFDSVGASRNTEQMHDNTKAMVNALIQQMNRINNSRMFIISATNLEKAVDIATKRRFNVIYFTRPSLQQRFALLSYLLQGWNFSGTDLQIFAERTERYTQDDITRVIDRAEIIAFSENRRLNQRDVLTAVNEIKPTEEYT